jgi:hypothetical protein
MFGKTLALISALALASIPAAAEACVLDGSQPATRQASLQPAATQTGGQSYGDRNRGGPYGFYSYPSHRHVDGGGGSRLLHPARLRRRTRLDLLRRLHGSAYYGRDYGAPYHGGAYYDGGTYYRERRD